MVGWFVSYELENAWKEAVLAHFKLLAQHLPGGLEENHDKPQSGWSAFGHTIEMRASQIRNRCANHSTTTFRRQKAT